MALTLVIMAAGMGSRYGGLKQIDPVGPNGEIIMDYSIYDAKKAGFDKVVFIIKEENYDLFKEVIGNRVARFMQVEYVFQKLDNLPEGYSLPEGRQKPWGTAHAILCCLGTVKESFAVINADDFYGRESFQKLADALNRPAPAGGKAYHFCMAGFILKNTLTENGHVARGVCQVDGNGILVDIHERTKIQRNNGRVQYTEDDGLTWTDLDENSIVSMNCWGFTPDFLQEIAARFPKFLDESKSNPLKAEFFLPFVVQDLIKEGKAQVEVLKTQDKWFGVTYKEDKKQVVAAIADKIAKGEYPANLWEGR